jgi:large subunit ribosomal protein L5e
VHAAIRANPVHEKKARSKPAGAKRWQPAKSTYEERKERLKQKLAMLAEGDDE